MYAEYRGTFLQEENLVEMSPVLIVIVGVMDRDDRDDIVIILLEKVNSFHCSITIGTHIILHMKHLILIYFTISGCLPSFSSIAYIDIFMIPHPRALSPGGMALKLELQNLNTFRRLTWNCSVYFDSEIDVFRTQIFNNGNDS